MRSFVFLTSFFIVETRMRFFGDKYNSALSAFNNLKPEISPLYTSTSLSGGDVVVGVGGFGLGVGAIAGTVVFATPGVNVAGAIAVGITFVVVSAASALGIIKEGKKSCKRKESF